MKRTMHHRKRVRAALDRSGQKTKRFLAAAYNGNQLTLKSVQYWKKTRKRQIEKTEKIDKTEPKMCLACFSIHRIERGERYECLV